MPQIRANGIDIEYESFGSETDPAILLIMGFSCQLTLWPVALCEGLAAKGFRVIRFDNRDIGKSTHLMDKGAPDIASLIAKVMSGKPAAAPYSLNDMADDSAALLDALGIKRAHIVGASMGGMIAQLMAVRYPEKTRSLISIMSTTGKRTIRGDPVLGTIRILKAIGSPGLAASNAELHATDERDIERVPYEPAGLARQMAAVVAAPPRNKMLRAVTAPTLVIHGVDDPPAPQEGGRDTVESIPGATLILVPGMNHNFTSALEPVLRQHIGDFVSSVEAR